MGLRRRSGDGPAWQARRSGRGDLAIASYDMLGDKREANMKLRLGFGVALVAVLFGLWLLSSKPSCVIGYRASLVSATAWTCVPE
jgi:hypothetical protein